MASSTKPRNELLSLSNVGTATLKDLQLLGIHTIEQLKKQDPGELYSRLGACVGTQQNICMRDLFAAIIHEAQTGEKLPWWHMSRLRKSYPVGIQTKPEL